MKKLVATVLALFLVLSLSACNSKYVDITYSAEFVNLLNTMGGTANSEALLESMKLDESIQEATLNSDGSISVKMDRAAWEETLENTKTSISAYIDEIISTQGTSITSIEFNKDLTVFTIKADSGTYKNNILDAISILGIGMQGYIYQSMAGNTTGTVTMNIVDATTRNAIATEVYPPSGN